MACSISEVPCHVCTLGGSSASLTAMPVPAVLTSPSAAAPPIPDAPANAAAAAAAATAADAAPAGPTAETAELAAFATADTVIAIEDAATAPEAALNAAFMMGPRSAPQSSSAHCSVISQAPLP